MACSLSAWLSRGLDVELRRAALVREEGNLMKSEQSINR